MKLKATLVDRTTQAVGSLGFILSVIFDLSSSSLSARSFFSSSLSICMFCKNTHALRLKITDIVTQ